MFDDEAPQTVTISTAPNELIPWPQIINEAKPLDTFPNNLKAALKAKLGRFDMLIARVVAANEGERPSVNSVLSRLSVQSLELGTTNRLPEAKNWQDLLEIVGRNDKLLLYNVNLVNEDFGVYTHTSRLRFFHDGRKPVALEIIAEVSSVLFKSCNGSNP